MEKQISSLESFMWIVETQHPEIKQFISNTKDSSVELHVPCDENKTWTDASKELSPLFSFPMLFPIKKHNVSYNEKHNYFKIFFELN